MSNHFSRREFAWACAGFFLAPMSAGRSADERITIESIEPRGMLIGDCTVAGETRKDDVVPAHPSGIQVARERWLFVYATRGFRGVDDDRSIIWQLRKGGPDGAVVREGLLARAHADWHPLGDGKKCFKQLGHPVVFGVPKGAALEGKPAVTANLFVSKWRVVGRRFDAKRDFLEHSGADPELARRSQSVEWVQFRLNEKEDDVEIVQPAAQLRQKGCEEGKAFCRAEVAWMNQSFTPAVPFNRSATEWADCNHFDGGRVAALKYVFNGRSQRYEWTDLGPFWGGKPALFEASLARSGDAWIVAARLEGKNGVAWARSDDPFARWPEPTVLADPPCNAPRTVFTCGDGVLRLLCGDPAASATKNARDPLYAWDIDPKSFAASNRRVVFDTQQAKLNIRLAAGPKVDMCKLLPAQGRHQLLVFRVSVRAYNFPYTGSSGKPTGIPVANDDEKKACGIYAARITYSADVAPQWQFA